MIFFIIDFFKDFIGIKVPVAFSYYSTRMMLAAITALVISIFLGPRFIKKLYELKIGQSLRTAELLGPGQLHKNKKDTPTMGGALILFSMLVSMFLWMDLTHVFTLILFLTTVFLGFLGARDDYLKLKYKNAKGLSARKKLLFQGLVGGFLSLYLLSPAVANYIQIGSWFEPPVVKEHIYTKSSGDQKAIGLISSTDALKKVARASSPWLVDEIKPIADQNVLKNESVLVGASSQQISLKEYASRIYVPFFKDYVLSFSGTWSILAALFIILVVTGTSNGVNLTDGLDGLAAGCLIMVASCLAFIAFVSNNIDIAGYLNILYIEGSGEIAIYLSAFVGACIGFLWYNGYPAQVFMGDTGSLALGGIIGVSAVLLKREVLLAVIGGIFVAEAVSVILQVGSFKLRNKKRIFLCTPLHHHFEYKGWPETKVVLRFWIVGLLLAIIGLASLKLQ